jgi:aspartate 1-decarboxylase
MITVLKSKLQEIVITAANINYEGSLTLDEDLMDEMGVLPFEQVFINSKYKCGRIMTYFIPGLRRSKCCELNGGAANHFSVGEIVHLLVFRQVDEQAPSIVKTPKIVHV